MHSVRGDKVASDRYRVFGHYVVRTGTERFLCRRTAGTAEQLNGLGDGINIIGEILMFTYI
jgi:hypothetical protein